MANLGDELTVIDGGDNVYGKVVRVHDDGSVSVLIALGLSDQPLWELYSGVTVSTDRDAALASVVDDGVPRVYAYPLGAETAAPVVVDEPVTDPGVGSGS